MSTPALLRPQTALRVEYSPEIEAEIGQLILFIEQSQALLALYPPRWLAIQLLEGDEILLAEVLATAQSSEVLQTLQKSRAKLQEQYGDALEVVLADYRYSFVHSLVKEVLTRTHNQNLTTSDRIDKIVTNRYFGIPLFLILIYFIFNLVQNVSAPFSDWLDFVLRGPLTKWVTVLLQLCQAPAWLLALVRDGVLPGVGGVLIFLPSLAILYLALALLEETGYMARAAFVMDQTMNLFGLHGKAFLPLILGFGCNASAIYATRTIESRPARIIVGLMVPFISCSARLPVYIVFGMAFFPYHADLIIFGLYMSGVIVACAVGLTLSQLTFRGEQMTMVMEMPAYHMPTLQNLTTYVWRNCAQFARNAGTVVLAMSVVLWLFLNLPWGTQNPRESLYGQVSATIAPLFGPAGFGRWEVTGALFSGFIDKRMIISSLAQLYGSSTPAQESTQPTTFAQDLTQIGEKFGVATLETGKHLLATFTPGLNLFAASTEPTNPTLRTKLSQVFSPLAAIAFLSFTLLCTPCIATLAAQAQEYGWRWAACAFGFHTFLSWSVAVVIYQGGRLVGLS